MLTVAGFASSAEDWNKFTLAWTDRLKRDGIEFFHAADLDGFLGTVSTLAEQARPQDTEQEPMCGYREAELSV